jgi:hypothetical protein
MENYQDSFAARQAEAQASLERAQKMQQYRAPQAPGMVGRVYVGTHPMQHLAELLRVHQGGKAEKEATSALGNISAERNKAITDALRGFSTNMAGAPEQRTPMQADAFDEADRASLGGNQNLTAVTPERKADPMAAYQSLMNAPDSNLRQSGMTGFLNYQKSQADQARQAQALQQLGQVQTPQEALALGIAPATVKDYFETKSIGQPKVDMAKDLMIPDGQGGWKPNEALVGVKTQISKAGAPKVDARTYNTQESEQSKVYGKALGEQRATIMNMGIEAPKRLAQVDRMEELLSGIEGGRLAPAMTDVQSSLNSVGIKVGSNLGSKEAAEALAVEMALKMRPPGSGPMTDKDFDNFLRTAPSLAKSAEGRRQITSTVRAAIQRDLQAADFMRQYSEANNGVIDDRFFQQLQNFYVQNPVVTPDMPATNSRGGQFRVVRPN